MAESRQVSASFSAGCFSSDKAPRKAREGAYIGYVTELDDEGNAVRRRRKRQQDDAGFFVAGKASEDSREGAYSGYVTDRMDEVDAAGNEKDKSESWW